MRLLPAWIQGYERAWLVPDLLAGVIVSSVVVPQAVAYAQIAGLPPSAGLPAARGALLAYSWPARPGRASSARLHPFVPAELGSDFDLEEVLRHGSLPLVWTSEDKRTTLAAYVQVYLREEIQAEALVRNLPSFARFLPLAALFHGQTLNVSSLARDDFFKARSMAPSLGSGAPPQTMAR